MDFDKIPQMPQSNDKINNSVENDENEQIENLSDNDKGIQKEKVSKEAMPDWAKKEMESYREASIKQGVDPEDYNDYFQIMADNDVPIRNKLPNFNNMLDMEMLSDYTNSWEELRDMYDKIDLEKQDENTGRGIIKEMKGLFKKFDELFKEHCKTFESFEYGKFPKPPKELLDLRKKILDLAERYEREVPAYIPYRSYGRFKLDPTGRRLFQIKDKKSD